MEAAWPLARWVLATIIASYIGASGLKKKSLSKSGAIAGFAVGLVSLGISLRLGIVLILFYRSSSMLTKVGADKKAKISDDYMEGGQRGAGQVLACSLFATILAVIHRVHTGLGDSMVSLDARPFGGALLCAYLGFYACCCGDTWSSELGVLSRRPPRLVTMPWREVPRGTNGGMSLMGTTAAALAGLFMGVAFFLLGWLFNVPFPEETGSLTPTTHLGQVGLIPLGVLSGLIGSILDSLMGAVFQATYYDRERKLVVEHPRSEDVEKGHIELVSGRDLLSNESINILSAVLTSIAAGASAPLFMW